MRWTARICHSSFPFPSKSADGLGERKDAGGAPREETLVNGGGGGGDAAGEEEDGRAVGARGRRPPSQELRQRRHGLQGFLPLSLLSYHVLL